MIIEDDIGIAEAIKVQAEMWELMELLWETDSFIDENTLTVNVGRLRKRLDGAGLENFITTKFGIGYPIEN